MGPVAARPGFPRPQRRLVPTDRGGRSLVVYRKGQRARVGRHHTRPSFRVGALSDIDAAPAVPPLEPIILVSGAWRAFRTAHFGRAGEIFGIRIAISPPHLQHP